MKIIIAIAFLGVAAAVCPNACNGHGKCGANDRCTCYGNWQGNDCNERTCPFGFSWSESTSDGNAAGHVAGHNYAECSDKGTCDRKSGECNCFDGYEGKACRRTTCPNACSGHGTCEYIEEIISGYEQWDAKKVMQCRCDPHYSGPDCSSRMCPKGDDPLTTGQVSEVQTVSITCTTNEFAIGDYSLVYTDSYGGVWTTRPIDGDATGATGSAPTHKYTGAAQAAQIETSLMGLPYWVVEDVVVSLRAPSSNADGIEYDITFTGAANQGDQSALSVLSTGCSSSAGGCSPLLVGVSCDDGTNGVTATNPTITVSESVKGTTENLECSNRGNCDGSTGLCECFDGFTGESCSTQTIYF